jgi:hypothetical protein
MDHPPELPDTTSLIQQQPQPQQLQQEIRPRKLPGMEQIFGVESDAIVHNDVDMTTIQSAMNHMQQKQQQPIVGSESMITDNPPPAVNTNKTVSEKLKIKSEDVSRPDSQLTKGNQRKSANSSSSNRSQKSSKPTNNA